MDHGWDLHDEVERLLRFRDVRDWQQFHRPKELAAALAIEAGELQELFLWRDPETAEAVRADAARLDRLREELADVAIFLVLLAHDLQVDLRQAVSSKISKNEQRYTVAHHRGVAEKAERPR